MPRRTAASATRTMARRGGSFKAVIPDPASLGQGSAARPDKRSLNLSENAGPAPPPPVFAGSRPETTGPQSVSSTSGLESHEEWVAGRTVKDCAVFVDSSEKIALAPRD